MINGTFCHERGCPNIGARWDAESGDWIKQYTCFECGCRADVGTVCCGDGEDEPADMCDGCGEPKEWGDRTICSCCEPRTIGAQLGLAPDILGDTAGQFGMVF